MPTQSALRRAQSARRSFLRARGISPKDALLRRYNRYTRASDQFAISPALTGPGMKFWRRPSRPSWPRIPATGAKAHATAKEVAGPWGF